MRRENLFLLAYIIALTIAPLGDFRHTIMALASLVGTLGVFMLYKSIGDETLFYIYNFLALIGIVVALGGYDPYSPITLLVAYALLSLVLLHITYARFTSYFGMVRMETVFYTLLTLLLSFFSVYLFLVYPMGYGFWGVFFLALLILVGVILLMRSSKSE